MTKKHFIAIAAAIRENLDRVEPYSNEAALAIGEMAHTIADVCASANSRFNRVQFLQACGVC